MNMDVDICSTEFGTFLNNLIEKKAKEIVQQEMKKYGNLRAWDSIVTSVNGNLINVHLIGDLTEITGLKNKTSQTLAIGDEVYLYSLSSLSNAYVAVAKNKP